MQENGPYFLPSCGTWSSLWFLQEGPLLLNTPQWAWERLSNRSIVDGDTFLLATSDLPNKWTACMKKSPVRANHNNICTARPLLHSVIADGECVRMGTVHRAFAGTWGCPQPGSTSPLLLIINMEDWHVLPLLPVAAEAKSVKQV